MSSALTLDAKLVEVPAYVRFTDMGVSSSRVY